MQSFLDQPEATFYHMTTIEKWLTIRQDGFNPKSGRVFVSRVGELPVLLSIALEQLPEIYETEEVVFLKFPQKKNGFEPKEIIPDNQAAVEWTQPFQNIILRKHIPPSGIELMMTIKLGQEPNRTFRLDLLRQIASSGYHCYKDHYITQRASELTYSSSNP